MRKPYKILYTAFSAIENKLKYFDTHNFFYSRAITIYIITMFLSLLFPWLLILPLVFILILIIVIPGEDKDNLVFDRSELKKILNDNFIVIKTKARVDHVIFIFEKEGLVLNNVRDEEFNFSKSNLVSTFDPSISVYNYYSDYEKFINYSSRNEKTVQLKINQFKTIDVRAVLDPIILSIVYKDLPQRCNFKDNDSYRSSLIKYYKTFFTSYIYSNISDASLEYEDLLIRNKLKYLCINYQYHTILNTHYRIRQKIPKK